MMELTLLFIASFIAATLLPLGSEVLLYALLQQDHSPVLLIAIATIGNTLGAIVNWWLGLYLHRFQNRRWFYFKEAQIERARHYYLRFGYISLLFSWLPVVGDLFTLAAGIFRLKWLPFVILVGFGKMARYGFIVYVAGFF